MSNRVWVAVWNAPGHDIAIWRLLFNNRGTAEEQVEEWCHHPEFDEDYDTTDVYEQPIMKGVVLNADDV